MTRLNAAASALLSGAWLLPAIAAAQPVQGLYFSVGAGANLAGNLLSEKQSTKIYTTVGSIALAGLGWGFGNGLRVEIEGNYRSNSVGGISTRRLNELLLPLANPSGNAATYAVMTNLMYDLPVRPLGLQPYIGAGVGYGWLDLGNVHGDGLTNFALPGNNTVSGPSVETFGTAGAPAYQAIAGTSVPLRILPGLSATLEYRFFGMLAADAPYNRVSTATGNTVNGVQPSSSSHNKFTVADHAILIGLRYSFGPAPAPWPPVAEPVAAPAPTPALSYLVFFDWDKATLTNRARQIIADAASASTKLATTRIETNGYTDTSGTPKYNQALLIRRAGAVAVELVREGRRKR